MVLCEFLVKYLEKENLVGSNIPYILGHSFGAHIALLFAFHHEHLVRALILADTAGIFPTLGEFGAFWGIYFKTIVATVQVLLRLLKGFSKWTAFTWFNYFCSPAQFYYWYTMISCPDQWGDSLVGSHITVTWTGSAYWTTPTLPILLAINCTYIRRT